MCDDIAFVGQSAASVADQPWHHIGTISEYACKYCQWAKVHQLYRRNSGTSGAIDGASKRIVFGRIRNQFDGVSVQSQSSRSQQLSVLFGRRYQ